MEERNHRRRASWKKTIKTKANDIKSWPASTRSSPTPSPAKKIFGNDGFQFFLFQKRWKNIVGDMLAKESYIKSWKDDTLVIAVTNSVFLQHLFMMKGDLLKRLFEDKFGKRFKDIRFIAGPRQKRKKPTRLWIPSTIKSKKSRKCTARTSPKARKNGLKTGSKATSETTN